MHGWKKIKAGNLVPVVSVQAGKNKLCRHGKACYKPDCWFSHNDSRARCKHFAAVWTQLISSAKFQPRCHVPVESDTTELLGGSAKLPGTSIEPEVSSVKDDVLSTMTDHRDSDIKDDASVHTTFMALQKALLAHDVKMKASFEELSDLKAKIDLLGSDAFGSGVTEAQEERVSSVEMKIINMEHDIFRLEDLQRPGKTHSVVANHIRGDIGDECHVNLGRLQESDTARVVGTEWSKTFISDIQDRLAELDRRMGEDLEERMRGALQTAVVPLAEWVSTKLVEFERRLRTMGCKPT